jgi:hypothetical protein
MILRVRLNAAVLDDVEAFLTDRGADGAEGTGLVSCTRRDDDWWDTVAFVAPEQHAEVGPLGCSVEVTERGKEQLAAALPAAHLYLLRVHSHPGQAFHSPTDDANPALTHTGALSIVVPYFGLGLRRGLDTCAVYRLDGGTWKPLPVGAERDLWLAGPDG